MMGNIFEKKGQDALDFASSLKKLSVDKAKWEILYLDEKTGEKWILVYPESENHGGGIPRIRKVKN